jgi:hypothetical protein
MDEMEIISGVTLGSLVVGVEGGVRVKVGDFTMNGVLITS